MRKHIFPFFMALLLAFCCAGCIIDRAEVPSFAADNASEKAQPATSETAPAIEPETIDPVSLRIMWWGAQTRHDRTLAVLDLYTENTGVQFEPEFYCFDDYAKRLNTLIAASDAPDLIQMAGNFAAYREYMECLNDYIKKGIIDISNADENFIGVTTLEGDTVGLSSGTNALAVAYDPALFEQAGVPLPTFKWTWDEYENAAKTIHEKLGILGATLDTHNEFTILTSIVSQYGTGESLFEEPYRLALNYGSDKYVSDYLDMVKRMLKAGAYPTPAQMAEIKDIEVNPLVKGESAMAWLYSSQFAALTGAAKRPLKLICMPRIKADGPLLAPIISCQMFCVYKKSPYKTKAAEFLSFFANDEQANMILKGERGVPIMRNVREMLKTSLTDPEKETYDYISNLVKESSAEITLDSPIQTEIRDIYVRLAEEVKLGKTASATAAEKFREEANAAIDRYNETK